ncbi:hypothetical protein I551_1244 [Mycobacterium ulcerans str. Harvey]|uniref:Uncharacterized protein n=1 Tax=Mycobacterium ulcerans str. Harvey TaxID=1299332 RepID=A0ABN0R514_MYCUL|nr:hypothetical protein I551_1244 [Mycobacterium ulcerans str. Harvey]
MLHFSNNRTRGVMLVMVRLPGMQGEELPQHLGGRHHRC